MNGDTYIYDGNLYSTGGIHKGTFSAATLTWAEQKKLNDYFIIKELKPFIVSI
jgi:hypothetical protein